MCDAVWTRHGSSDEDLNESSDQQTLALIIADGGLR
jgi:hypothetical protein